MTRRIKAAVFAISLAFCASSANAADFLSYTFSGIGSGTTFDWASNSFIPRTGRFTFTYVLPLNGGIGSIETTDTSSAFFGLGQYYHGTTSMTASGNALSFSETGQTSVNYPAHVSATACLADGTGGAFPTSTPAVNASCGSFDMYESGYHTLYQYHGTIDALDVVQGSGSYGLQGLNGWSFAATVPEPGTWTMMLVGFAMMGVGLRRRPRILAAA